MRRTLGSRKGIGAGAMIALCLSAASAVAQDRPVTSRQDRADTVKINVSGKVEMDYIQREAALMAVPAMDSAGVADNNSVNTVEGSIHLRFDVELTEKVSAVVEIARVRVDEDPTGAGAVSGVVPFLGSGGDAANDVTIRRAHLQVADFLAQGLVTKLGIQDWSFNPRGKGGALMFDPFNSQSITRNIANVQATAGGMAALYGISTAAEQEPVGVHMAYTSGQLTIDLVALPVIGEGGPVSEDEALYAVDFWYNLDQMGKGSRIGAIAAFHNLPTTFGPTGGHSRMITLGAGASLAFNQIDVFGEAYFQFGSVGRDAANDELDAAGSAFRIGARYNAGGDSGAWLEVSFTLISGDDSTDPADDENEQFLSYESVNDFLIIEDMYFGLDVDTNLTAIKVMGGASFDVAGGKKNVDLMAGLGFFTSTEEVAAGAEDEDALGTELDVKARYHLNKQAYLALNFGILFGSDLLEEMSGGAASDVSDDSTWLASLGFNVNW